jgi:hypothetical protein
MTPTPIEKEFDCMAYKREAQLKIYEKIKDMTTAEQATYFQQAVESGPFAELWKSLRQSTQATSHS